MFECLYTDIKCQKLYPNPSKALLIDYLHIQLLNIQHVVWNRRQQQNRTACPFQVSACLTCSVWKSNLAQHIYGFYLFTYFFLLRWFNWTTEPERLPQNGARVRARKGTVQETVTWESRDVAPVPALTSHLSVWVFAALQHAGKLEKGMLFVKHNKKMSAQRRMETLKSKHLSKCALRHCEYLVSNSNMFSFCSKKLCKSARPVYRHIWHDSSNYL